MAVDRAACLIGTPSAWALPSVASSASSSASCPASIKPRHSAASGRASPSVPYVATTEDAAVSLTPGRLNAVRAGFRAGVTLSRIARQFGISHSSVRKAQAGSLSKSAEP